MNVNTYKYSNKLRFLISFGISPDILFSCKSLNNCKKINMIFFAKDMIDILSFVYFKYKYGDDCKQEKICEAIIIQQLNL